MSSNILTYSLILLFLIINLQNLFESSSVYFQLFNLLQLIFLLYVLFCTYNKESSDLSSIIKNKVLLLLYIFLFIVFVGMVRSSQLDMITSVSIAYDICFYLLVVVLALNMSSGKYFQIHNFFKGILLYLITNIVLLAVGVENPVSAKALTEEATFLKYLGIDTERSLYPLHAGAARVGIGMIAGCFLTYIVALFPVSKRKGILLLTCIVPLWILLAADTRGALLSCFISLFMFYLTRKLNFRFIRFLPFAIPLFPILIGLTSYIAFQSGIATDIAREGTADISTGRSILWAIAYDELSDFKPIHLIGYGSYGQAISGVSYTYMNLFRSWPDEYLELHSLHNAALQMVFDIGYIGLALYIYLLYRLLCKSIYSTDYNTCMLMPVVCFLILTGITEASPIYYRNIFVIFILVATYLARHNSNTTLNVVN